MILYLHARIAIASRRGAETWGFGFIISCLVFGAAYSMFPESFHGFFQWVLNGVFDALGQSFGTDPQSPAGGQHPKNLSHLPTTTRKQ